MRLIEWSTILLFAFGLGYIIHLPERSSMRSIEAGLWMAGGAFMMLLILHLPFC